MFFSMAAMAEGRMNLAALQQRDPYITDIVDTASQVALYSFSSKSNEWVGIFQYERFRIISPIWTVKIVCSTTT